MTQPQSKVTVTAVYAESRRFSLEVSLIIHHLGEMMMNCDDFEDELDDDAFFAITAETSTDVNVTSSPVRTAICTGSAAFRCVKNEPNFPCTSCASCQRRWNEIRELLMLSKSISKSNREKLERLVDKTPWIISRESGLQTIQDSRKLNGRSFLHFKIDDFYTSASKTICKICRLDCPYYGTATGICGPCCGYIRAQSIKSPGRTKKQLEETASGRSRSIKLETQTIMPSPTLASASRAPLSIVLTLSRDSAKNPPPPTLHADLCTFLETQKRYPGDYSGRALPGPEASVHFQSYHSLGGCDTTILSKTETTKGFMPFSCIPYHLEKVVREGDAVLMVMGHPDSFGCNPIYIVEFFNKLKEKGIPLESTFMIYVGLEIGTEELSARKQVLSYYTVVSAGNLCDAIARRMPPTPLRPKVLGVLHAMKLSSAQRVAPCGSGRDTIDAEPQKTNSQEWAEVNYTVKSIA